MYSSINNFWDSIMSIPNKKKGRAVFSAHLPLLPLSPYAADIAFSTAFAATRVLTVKVGVCFTV